MDDSSSSDEEGVPKLREGVSALDSGALTVPPKVASLSSLDVEIAPGEWLVLARDW